MKNFFRRFCSTVRIGFAARCVGFAALCVGFATRCVGSGAHLLPEMIWFAPTWNSVKYYQIYHMNRFLKIYHMRFCHMNRFTIIWTDFFAPTWNSVTQTEIFLVIFLHHAWEYRRIIGFSYTIEIYDISCWIRTGATRVGLARFGFSSDNFR